MSYMVRCFNDLQLYSSRDMRVKERERKRDIGQRSGSVKPKPWQHKLDKALTDITSRLEMKIKERRRRRRKAKYKPFCKHDSKSSHQPPCTNFKKNEKWKGKIVTWKHLPTLHLLSLFVDFFWISLMYFIFWEGDFPLIQFVLPKLAPSVTGFTIYFLTWCFHNKIFYFSSWLWRVQIFNLTQKNFHTHSSSIRFSCWFKSTKHHMVHISCNMLVG